MARSELEKMGRARFGSAYDTGGVDDALAQELVVLLQDDEPYADAQIVATWLRSPAGVDALLDDPGMQAALAARGFANTDRDSVRIILDQVREAGRQEGRAEAEEAGA